MSESDQTTATGDNFGDAKSNWRWLVGLGVVFLVLGVIGLGMSVTLTLAGVLVFGWLLIFGSVAQIIDTFYVKGWKSVLWHVLMAIIYLVTGLVVIYDPVGSAIALTLIIGIGLIAAGIARIFIAFQLRPAQIWWLVLVGGLISILLGLMVMARWPVSSFWVIGLFIAVEMIANGWSYVMMGMTARAAEQGDN